jgi:hypothetical protein
METIRETQKGSIAHSDSNFINHSEDDSYLDLYILLDRDRDSNHMTESNFETALELLGGESETVQIHRFGSWLCGWFEYLCIDSTEWIDEDWRSGAYLHNWYFEEAENIEDSLSSYPCLDDEDLSRREIEAFEESYQHFIQTDLEREIESREEEAETNFFCDEEGEINLSSDEDQALFICASKNASNCSYESWSIEEIVNEFLDDNIHRKLNKHPDLFEPNDTYIISTETGKAIERLLSI